VPERDAVTIAVVYPDLLGTYGDGGNAAILARRLEWRGVPARILQVTLGTPLPSSCDVYLLGGGEDAPQALAAEELRRAGSLRAAVDRGAAVLAVCAGLQVVGARFSAGDRVHDGVGLADIDSLRRLPRRAVGELVVEPDAELGLPILSGYENHASVSVLGPDVRPFGRVRSGVGNGDPAADRSGTVDGVLAGHLLGTYLHGPALARNPELADLLVRWVLGDVPVPQGEREAASLEAADRAAADLRTERLDAVGRPARRRARLRRSAHVSPLAAPSGSASGR